MLSALDADTRDYLKLLVSGAGKGLEGRGDDLRETFRRFSPLHRDLNRVTEAIAERRTNLRRLIHNYGLLVDELGDKDRELTRLVSASNAVFESFAAEDQNVSAFVAKLPGSLRETRVALEQGRPARPAPRPGARVAAPGLPRARRRQRGGPAVRRGGHADRARRDPPVRARRAPFFRDLGKGADDLAKAGSGPDGDLPRPQPPLQHRRLQPERRARG